MSFTYYTVDTGIETSQVFWSFDAVADHVELCDAETTLPVFLAALPKNEPILDAGCGLARWVIFLRTRGYRVVGTDRRTAPSPPRAARPMSRSSPPTPCASRFATPPSAP